MWKVSKNFDGEAFLYQVYRTINEGMTDHSGNREYLSEIFGSRALAQAVADRLNRSEA